MKTTTLDVRGVRTDAQLSPLNQAVRFIDYEELQNVAVCSAGFIDSSFRSGPKLDVDQRNCQYQLVSHRFLGGWQQIGGGRLQWYECHLYFDKFWSHLAAQRGSEPVLEFNRLVGRWNETDSGSYDR